MCQKKKLEENTMKGNKKALIIVLALIAIAAIVVGVLFATGVLGGKKAEEAIKALGGNATII